MEGKALFGDVFQDGRALPADLNVINDFALGVLLDRVDVTKGPFAAEAEINQIALMVTGGDFDFLFLFEEAHGPLII